MDGETGEGANRETAAALLTAYSMIKTHFIFLVLALSATQLACSRHSVREFVSLDEPIIALTHVRVIDGTGSPAHEDQTILIEAGRIKAIGSAANLSLPGNAKVLELNGHTALPGLVGMHEHLFYSTGGGTRDVLANGSFPQLYLAAGVTTIRTGGTLSLESDLKTKQLIDKAEAPGPKIHLTSPYINRPTGQPLGAEKINKLVNEWADEGVTSLKVYTNIGSTELAAVIAAARKRGLKVTGHLCALGFREAAALGIDNLEHGLSVDTEFYSGKHPDNCPERSYWLPELARLDVRSQAVQQMIRELVSRHVAITSTLPIFESFIGDKFQLDPRMQAALTEDAYASCLSHIESDRADPRWARIWEVMLRKEMEFEREFVKAGGLLLAGVDPTGWGGVIAGFGDQRGLELLVEAGFTPEEAIRIASANGAEFLGESDHIGSLVVGKQADIVIVRGNPSVNIKDVRNVTIVFKDGVGYDPAKLIDSVRNQVGR
jgi:imidazolonepropionase-like amidohydrolase